MARKVKTRPQSRKRYRQNERKRGEPSPHSDTVWFLLIFLFAFGVRLIYLLQVESIPLFYNLAGDGRTYDEWAQRIAAGDWLGTGVFYQAPLYPYFLGALQIFFGHNLWLVRVVQIALGALSCGLIFCAGRQWFSRNAGIASGLILACYGPAIFFDGLIEKSILDLFLVSLLLLLLSQVRRDSQRSTKWMVIGALVGVLGLSRENALILIPVLALWLGLYFSGQPILARLGCIGLFVAGVLLVLVPVGMRNLTLGGEFKLTTSQFGTNFFIGNNPVADGTYGSVRSLVGEPHLEGADAKRLAEKALRRSLTPGEVSDYWVERSWNYIVSQPGAWFVLFGKKWLMVWNDREVEDSDDYYIYRQWSSLLNFFGWINRFGILAPLAAVGLWLARKEGRHLSLICGMTLALALSIALFYVFGRYRFTLVPLLVLFAGAGLVRSVSLYQQRAWRPFRFVLPIFAFVAGVVNWPIYGLTGPGPGGYNNLANAYAKQGRIEDATRAALKAVELQPGYGVAHYNLGNLYAEQGRFDLAQAHFEETLRLYPNYAEACSSLGQLIAERGDVETGIRYFRKAIELNPSLSRAHLNLGVALGKRGKIDAAVQSLEKAARLAPESAEARNHLGSLYAAQGRYGEAAVSFRDALRIQPDYPQAHQSLAQILLLQGKKEEAMRHYQEATRVAR